MELGASEMSSCKKGMGGKEKGRKFVNLSELCTYSRQDITLGIRARLEACNWPGLGSSGSPGPSINYSHAPNQDDPLRSDLEFFTFDDPVA
jgi:hypothetical protein